MTDSGSIDIKYNTYVHSTTTAWVQLFAMFNGLAALPIVF